MTLSVWSISMTAVLLCLSGRSVGAFRLHGVALARRTSLLVLSGDYLSSLSAAGGPAASSASGPRATSTGSLYGAPARTRSSNAPSPKTERRTTTAPASPAPPETERRTAAPPTELSTEPLYDAPSKTELLYDAPDTMTSAGSPPPPPPPPKMITITTTTVQQDEEQGGVGGFDGGLTHAELAFFAVEKMTPKGPRTGADVGDPHDASRPLATVGPVRVGAWWCAAGGWPSPKRRDTTEVFYVLAGHGCLTDLDGARHFFGPGDTVVLPKGWSGRWDVLAAIHKVWFVLDHPWVEEDTESPIRPTVAHYCDHPATTASTRKTAATFYDLGPTQVQGWTCNPGSFADEDHRGPDRAGRTEWVHVLQGLFVLTDAKDGKVTRCTAGDTLLLPPKGWSGRWDVIEPVRAISATSKL